MATYLNRTPSSASNRKTWTYSTWLKRSQLSAGNAFFAAGAGTVEFTAYFVNNNTLEVYQYDSGTYRFRYITNQVFRDTSAWYHIVIACDTTQGSASDRVKIYVNGSQITSFSTNTTPSQNQDTSVNLNTPHVLGRYHTSASGYYLGYMAQTILVDGTALTPSTFGSTNTNGIWIPNTGPSVTYGTNGFKLDFAGTGTTADASGFGADSSGNGNHFTANSLGTNPSTTDTCQNNFATLDPLSNFYPASTFSQGNNKIQTATSTYSYNVSSIGVSKGKWFMEARAGAKSGGGNWYSAGIAEGPGTSATLTLGRDTNYPSSNGAGQIGYYGYATNWVYQNDAYYLGSASNYTTSNYGNGSIIGIALDADNNNVKFYADGVVQNSGTAFTIGASSTGFWHFAFGDFDGSNNYIWQTNFGNPTYTIASGNADANGYGNFEYAVPSGYYALCTKNLAAYGG